MHILEFASINLADCLHAADVEEQDLLVCAYRDGERAIVCHLDAVNVSLVSLEIRNVLACFTVPHFNVFVHLAARQQHKVVRRIETDGAHNCLVT